VCPSSNVALGVAASPAQVPLRRLVEAGVPVALGADDPLLFGTRLTAQYEIARQAHGFTDAELADLARMSVLSSAAPEPVRARLLTGIDAWLNGADQPAPEYPRQRLGLQSQGIDPAITGEPPEERAGVRARPD
jgi:adenosine deaminase